ncbi:MAG: Trp family transcriptional regulator [Patescibacteria group bacterium]
MKVGKEEQYKKELRDVIRKAAKEQKLLDDFLKDILTPAEYREVANRLQIVKLLKQGYSHREIVEILGVGVATIERGVRVIADKNGGINRVLGG